MKQLLKYLSLGVVLATSSAAFANPLVGTLTIDGGIASINPTILNSSTSKITFKQNDEATFFGTGDFSGAGISFVPFNSPFLFAVGPTFPGELLFTVNDPFGVDQFTVNQVMTAANGALTFYGSLTDGSNGNFILTPNVSQDGSFSGTLTASASPSPTPEPNSLILLGTGLAGAAGMLMFRRRRTATSAMLLT